MPDKETGRSLHDSPFDVSDADLSSRTVLIADDESSVRRVLVETVHREFLCPVTDFSSGDEALEHLASNPADVLITDMMMPGTCGIELIHAAKEACPEIDILVITGFTGDFTFIDVIQAGATDFMSKPGTPAEIQAKLYRVFREKVVRERLLQTEAKYRAMFERSVSSNILLDANTLEIRDANKAFLDLAGAGREEVVSASFMEIVRPAERDRVQMLFDLLEKQGGGTMGGIGLSVSGDEDLIADASLSFINIGDESILLMNLIDITERRRVEQQLASAVVTDQLTGLSNRRAFNTELEGAIIRSARNDEHLTLMMIDLDNFKQCNDNHGHQTGDAVLQSIAEVIRSGIRDGRGDEAYRLGGDEFAVLLSGTAKQSAMIVGDRMREAFEQRETFGTTLSIGIAEFVPGQDTEDFIKAADEVLYDAKGQGKNTVRVA